MGVVTEYNRRADDPKPAEPERGLTLDELEAASGVPARTIRFYRQSGLIESPERHGRRAFYDASQLDRLRLISQLRDRGLGLDAIAKVVDDPTAARRSLSGLLQLSDELRKPWIEDRSAVLTRLEVVETLGTDLPENLQMLEDYGVITRMSPKKPEMYSVPSVATLELAGDMAAAGIAPELINASWIKIQQKLSQLARDLVALYTSHDIGDGVLGTELTRDELLDGFAQLRPIALQAVQLSFAHEIERALEEFVEQGGVFSLKDQALGT